MLPQLPPVVGLRDGPSLLCTTRQLRRCESIREIGRFALLSAFQHACMIMKRGFIFHMNLRPPVRTDSGEWVALLQSGAERQQVEQHSPGKHCAGQTRMLTQLWTDKCSIWFLPEQWSTTGFSGHTEPDLGQGAWLRHSIKNNQVYIPYKEERY